MRKVFGGAGGGGGRRTKMINANQNVLFLATILALCVISFVHVFLFPLYDVDQSKKSPTKNFYDFEQSQLCLNSVNNVKHRRTSSWKRLRCPRYGIVTIMQGGRLGNQMWEYASVWALARRTGLEPYVPRCIHVKLEQIFEQLSVPNYEEIGDCPIDLARFVRSVDAWNYTNQSIVLPRYSTHPDVVLTWVQDIIQEFTFKRRFQVKSQNVLRLAAATSYTKKPKASSSGTTDLVYVGIHVRRTDYIGYLWRKHAARPASPAFFHTAMDIFEGRYERVLFVVVSDDPAWCHDNLNMRPNVFVSSRTIPNAPALDLAILASCNHSIFDYGTFGIWGAILAGGDTIYFNLTKHSSARVGRLLSNWTPLN
ncbi:PREDICTED: galactoside 2-alpha-L-fucosyltransferase 2-like isoform X2 [Nicrophorus vespilloides]|uniref:L-Fucosyltransferase n=1 Tax=Nicrophorus vespilloides TaxID=110193 RepID=A0ABM1MCJ7_NICVS|nr:PREDICTED: galactoside 2-alpha-L-fucosyltransferase 2-like isoform X2 [Nicrophorus vespilloides]